MRLWLSALLATLSLSPSAAAETVTFRSTTWPPTPLQQRLATAVGQTIAELASTRIAGELYLPAGRGPLPPRGGLTPPRGPPPLKAPPAPPPRPHPPRSAPRPAPH